MKIVKNVHNNISICLDSRGNEVVAFGKGIGFKKPPYDISLNEIERTFYNVSPMYIDMLSQLPENVVNVSAEIVDYANTIMHGKHNANLVFTLADHIWFSIKRDEKKIHIKLPLVHEVKHMYPNEMKIGEYALKIIQNELGVKLPQEEASVITLHVIDYGIGGGDNYAVFNDQTTIDKCTDVVETYMNIEIDKEAFNYSRFVTHMYYLLERVENKSEQTTDNSRIFESLIEEYPKTYETAKRICDVLKVNLNDEEIIYLILHINRLTNREEAKD